MAESFAAEALAADGHSANLTWSLSLVLGGAIVFLFLIDILLTPRLDLNEPYLLKPKIPLIGHIIGIIGHQTDYHRVVK